MRLVAKCEVCEKVLGFYKKVWNWDNLPLDTQMSMPYEGIKCFHCNQLIYFLCEDCLSKGVTANQTIKTYNIHYNEHHKSVDLV